MSTVNPNQDEYQTPDGLKVAKDVAWVIRTLIGGAIAFVLAAVWVIALANDVKTNTDKIGEAATKTQIELVLSGIEEIKGDLKAADGRQRAIKSQLDRLHAEVENLKEE